MKIFISVLEPIGVLDAEKDGRHITIDIGNYTLVSRDNPVPGYCKDPLKAPKWYCIKGYPYGMVLEAWIRANIDGRPIVEVLEFHGTHQEVDAEMSFLQDPDLIGVEVASMMPKFLDPPVELD